MNTEAGTLHFESTHYDGTAEPRTVPGQGLHMRSKADHIFVFGSNLAGRHGAGAAKFALDWRSAILGQGEGAQGRSYAIPTKDAQLRPLPLRDVAEGVRRFLDYARSRPGDIFQVTRIGCGLAGFTDDQIYPLFADAPDNCQLPGIWLQKRDPKLLRVIVAGGRDYQDRERLFAVLDDLLPDWRPLRLTLISGGASGADALGEAWAESRVIAFERFDADWNRYGKAAGPIRNTHMSWYATHLVAFPGGRGTAHMVETARRDLLHVYVV